MRLYDLSNDMGVYQFQVSNEYETETDTTKESKVNVLLRQACGRMAGD